ncbi:MAG: hypothetical protein LQ342_002000 [Letrouitia transgressa]|nr:MAG: hypothetical protein LQ342_002000 [Letrouitia transgressa]
MPPSSRSPTPPTKRLLQELKAQTQDPAPFLHSLSPASESELLSWEAVMKGVPGTPYEALTLPLSLYSRPLAPEPPNPAGVPPVAADDPLHDARYPSERLVPHGRDLPLAAVERALEPRVHAPQHAGGGVDASGGRGDG